MSKITCDYLVVDSGGFLKNGSIREISQKAVYTTSEVVDEIKDKATKQRLQVLPYELLFRQPNAEAIKLVTDFSKKTGDYSSLSATDIKVLALTYMLEVEKVGTSEHLKLSPTIQKTVNFYKPNQDNPTTKLAGFYKGDANEEKDEKELISNFTSFDYWREASDEKNSINEFSSFSYWRDPIPSLDDCVDVEEDEEIILDHFDQFFETRSYVLGHELSPSDFIFLKRMKDRVSTKSICDFHPHVNRWFNHIRSFNEFSNGLENSFTNDLFNAISSGKKKDEKIIEQVHDLKISNEETPVQNNSDGCSTPCTTEEEEEDDDDDDDDLTDDDDEWITPSNIKEKKQMMSDVIVDNEVEHVAVACMTTDFAMQNVCRQMGLNVVSVDGLLIRNTKTWILRCYACFKTTHLMHKQFCPKCGNKTLKRVSVTVNEDGSQQIHISTRTELTAKGKKFSLPKPQGGKHAVNPILKEGQRLPQQRKTKVGRQKTDALNPDYIAGSSPFALHDVTSRSAMIGTPGMGVMNNLYWMRKNPNASVRGTGNRKKNRK